MPGLAGVYDPRADLAQIEGTLQRMARVLATPSDPHDVDGVARPGLGCLTLKRRQGETHVAQDRQHGIWLVCDGELYNAAELAKPLGLSVGATPIASADLCLALLLREGDDFVRRLNGQFNLVIGRAADHSLRLITDRYGYRPLFVSQTATRLLFGTRMKAILSVRDDAPRPDGVGIMWLATTGRLFGDRTWVDGIRVVDPGTIVEISARGVARQRYFRLHFCAAPRSASLQDFADGFAAALVGAAARMTGASERVGITLSGGLDSRSTLLALSRHRGPAVTCSFGAVDSRDVRYAGQLAAAVGVPHLHLPYEHAYLDQVLAPVAWQTEGLVPFASAQYTSLHFHPRMAEHMDVILSGHCGDAMTGAHLQPHILLAQSRRQLIDRIMHHHHACAPDTVRRMFNPRFYRDYAAAAAEEARHSIDDIDQARLVDVANVWDMEHRQRRSVFHSATLDRYRFAVRTLFLDNEVVDHLRQAPPRWRVQQMAYKRMIVTAFPAAAHVPWAYTDRRLRTRIASDLVDVTRNHVAARIRHHAPPAGVQFRDLVADTRAAVGVAQAIRDFTASDYFPDAVFDRAGIDEIVDRHWSRREDHTHAVIMLATFAAAWRLLVAIRPTEMPVDAMTAGPQRRTRLPPGGS